ncbi:MAG: glycine zipper domain-containing protein [Campylobacterota bacterium]
MKKNRITAIFGITALLLGIQANAAQIDGSAVLGSAIGAAAGSAVGSAVGGKDGAVIGGGIGGAVGAAAGSGKSSVQPSAQVRVGSSAIAADDDRGHRDHGLHKGHYKHKHKHKH